ncbi:pilus assembly protein TadG-related protein [Jeongeupia sp. USM3]|uniref:pilus assembly protein TadG-related protein n=1 Tax=Jeongeupia sp. USM3 TaxID=1906741 RepID=UPI00089DEEC3|nr:pilus assembly protein TadG-related protein [Jeongeupia sp. USM3]AOY01199.1 hypothetical protein BJP62_12550 [Jeongeupia sp. USM3]
MKRQHGGMALAVGATLLLGVVLLGVLDAGRLYVERRELQKIADFAALAAAQSLYFNPKAAADQSAAANGAGTASVQCFTGHWQPASPKTLSNEAACGTVPAGSGANAVRIQVDQPTFQLFFLPGNQAVSAQAIAMPTQSYASFSLGSALLEVDTGNAALADLNNVLKGLGVNVPLTLADNSALLASRITVGELMAQLGAASMDALLDTTVTYEQYRVATVNALQARGDSAAAVAAGKLLSTTVANAPVRIGENGAFAGILKLALVDAPSGLATELSAGDLLMSGLQLANKNSAVNLGLNLGLGALGLAEISATLVKPAVYAAGRPGKKADNTWYTEAHGNQSSIHLAAVQLPLLPPALTVGVQVAPARAALSKVSCDGDQTKVEIEVSKAAACISTSLLGIPLIPCLPVAPGVQPIAFTVDADGSVQAPNPVKVGSSQTLLGIPLLGIDTLVLGLLKGLGVNVGTAQVKLISARCQSAGAALAY